MKPKSRSHPRYRLASSTSRRLTDYAPVAARLPVLEESVIQVQAGDFQTRVATAATEEVAMIQVHVIPESVGVTILEPGHIGFAIPHWWSGDYRINGVPASPTAIYFPDAGRSCHIVSKERVTTGVIVREKLFVETVAALRGLDPDDVHLDMGCLYLAPKAAAGLQRDLNAILSREVELQQSGEQGGGKPFETQVLTAMVDGFLAGSAAEKGRRSFIRNACHIVRKAEDRFAEAGAGPVSLADLCLAAGVGKSALYEAFHFVCDMAPLSYFHKRKLNKAKTALIDSRPGPGAVKMAALEAGFTEMGRFSGDYNKLFGELPSVTLTKVQL